MFEVLHDKPWWKGLFILEYRTDPDHTNTSYIPYKKPAEKVIAKWFDISSPT